MLFHPFLRYGDSLYFISKIQIETITGNAMFLPDLTTLLKYLHNDFAGPQYYPNLKTCLC